MSFIDVLKRQEEASAQVNSQLRNLWKIIGDEISIASMIPPQAGEIHLANEMVIVPIAYSVARSNETTKQTGRFDLELPAIAFDAGEQGIKAALKRALPLTCRQCGLNHRVATVSCLGGCGHLVWRIEAPPARFYCGYYQYALYNDGGCGRDVRFVFDLSERALIDLWVPKVGKPSVRGSLLPDRKRELINTLCDRFGDLAFQAAAGFEVHGHSALLTFDLPEWSRGAAIHVPLTKNRSARPA